MPAFDLAVATVEHAGKGDFGGSASAFDMAIAPAAGAPDSALSFGNKYLRRITVPELGPYSARTFVHQARSVPIEFSLLAAYPLFQGLNKWNWGKSDFHFSDEGWFGKDTKYLGMDKLGHAFGAYLYADFLTQRIAQKSDDRVGAAVTGSLMGLAIQLGVEIGDGFSPDQGFSPQDMVFNSLGAGFSLLRNAVPGLAEKVDFRIEYWDSDYSTFDPTADYDGQKYLLALKLGGFEEFEDTPLRFFELHAGYFARGVIDKAVAKGVKRRREPYVGIGFNLRQLIGESPAGGTTPGLFASRFLEYYQPPYSYVATEQN